MTAKQDNPAAQKRDEIAARRVAITELLTAAEGPLTAAEMNWQLAGGKKPGSRIKVATSTALAEMAAAKEVSYSRYTGWCLSTAA